MGIATPETIEIFHDFPMRAICGFPVIFTNPLSYDYLSDFLGPWDHPSWEMEAAEKHAGV